MRTQTTLRSLSRLFLFLIIVAALALAACGDDKEEATKESFTIGILSPIDLFDPTVEGFKEGMAALGYTEGDNITYVYDGPVGNFGDDLKIYADELVKQKVDVILAITTPATAAAQQATDSIPIVFTLVTDPVGAGFVESWKQPGGTITGLSDANPDSRRLQLLKEMIPDLDSVYMPLDTSIQAVAAALEDVAPTAEDLGVELVTVEVHTPEDVQQSIADIPENVDAVFLLPDVTTNEFLAEYGAAALERGLPFSTTMTDETENVLMSFGVEFYPSGEQAARLVSQVLRGTKPGDLPVESIEFSLMVNLKTAEKLGLEVPSAVLSQADLIIRAED